MPIIKERQTITDIAVQYTGSADAALEIARLNGRSVTDVMEPGTFLIIPQPTNRRKADFYARREMDPAMEMYVTNKPGGIGYMQIGTDFIVS